jgi:F420-0:gamma-glutamyl ligase
MRKSAGCPVVLLRGFEWKAAEGSARSLIRTPEQDLFR